MSLLPPPSEKPLNLIAFAFLLIAFLTGIASSFQQPTLSLFLSQEIHASPFMVGLFYSANAIIGILLSQLIAAYSDKQEDRRKVIMICCLLSIIGCVIFAYCRNYWILIILGTTLLGLGSASNPQSFALAREYTESAGKESVMFTTIMRTQISLAWIVGPPLSFAIALNWGFSYMYLVAGAAFLLCALATICLLPKISRNLAKTQQSGEIIEAPRTQRKSTAFLFADCLLCWMCNSMYFINMPLYLIHQLHLPEQLAGILMGTAAGLEIPVMLLAGYLTRFLSKKQLMFTALFCGGLFYIGLSVVQQTWMLIALQGLNAIFIGIIATIGMVYFQDLMPRQMGAATTLFSNTAKSSWIIGGPVAGFIAEFWHYNSVFYVSILILLVAAFCLHKVKSV
ncbi:MFS transporter [Caviibacterium pharyngocola]|uniref:MFS transporter n=1 Tax=Caviibacterium pharyngocola TaxID=28159 RepID=A0A2M8RYZ5_9PAST|nr:MFS transporter [Caviibacterium pharyngocola]PJG84117.1 MFS transporter [Caviibacterium pharyngocola]